MLSTAAADLATINGTALAAIDRLNAAVRHLHADEVGLAMQQQRQASRLESVWHVCADVREEVSNMRVTLGRHMQASAEIHNFLQLEAKRHEGMLQMLLRRTRKNELLLRNEAVKRAEESTAQRLRLPAFKKWREFSRRRSVCRIVMRKTKLRKVSIAFQSWRLWAKWAHKQLKYFRALEFSEEKNSRLLVCRYYQKFQRFVAIRHRMKRAATWLLQRNMRYKLLSTFSSWRRFQERQQALRRVFSQKLKLNETMDKKVKQRLMHCYFVKWTQYRVHRHKFQLLRDVAIGLTRRITGDRGRQIFLKWKSFAREQRNHRKKAGHLAVLANKALLKKYFSHWQKLQLHKWVGRQIHVAVAEVDAKVDIGLRTTSNMNETIQKMIEHYHQLSQTTSELSRSKVSHHQLRPTAFRETAEQVQLHDRFQELVDNAETNARVSSRPLPEHHSGFDDPMRGVVHAGPLSSLRGPSFASRSESPSSMGLANATRRTQFGAVQTQDPSRIGGLDARTRL